MQNVWNRLGTSDVKQAMRLVGCEPKYSNGTASDFECFREWISVIRLFEGNRTANEFAEQISELVGQSLGVAELSSSSAKGLWRRCNEALCGVEYTCRAEQKNDYTSSVLARLEDCGGSEDCEDIREAVKNAVRDGAADVYELRDAVEKSTRRRILLCPTSESFERPDRYHATLDLKRVQDGAQPSDILLCQTVCELCFVRGETVRLSLLCGGNVGYSEELVRYFSDRGLFVRIFLTVGIFENAEDILRICKAGHGNCAVTPAVMLRSDDSEAARADFLRRLAEIYPIGAVRFVKK